MNIACRSCFPEAIISRVLLCGLQDFHMHSHPDVLTASAEPHLPKMGSVIGILSHLAVQHSSCLEQAMWAIVEVCTSRPLSIVICMLMLQYQHCAFIKALFWKCPWPSVLWCCWLGIGKGIRPVKTECWGAGMVICLEWGADLHMAQLMPLPLTVSCFSKIQIGFTFLVLAYLGSLRANSLRLLNMCVCVFGKRALLNIINIFLLEAE